MHPVMNIPRTIEPEWLDELAADDPRAMRSRRDLTRSLHHPAPRWTAPKPLRILAKTKEPRPLSRSGFSVNWWVRQFRTYD